jgi:PTH1 family peptidyl-tRNA hydrolase
LASRYGVRLKKRLFGNAREARHNTLNKGLLLIEPMMFMNLSGSCVLHYIKKYHIPMDKTLIICDDINLHLGDIRIKPGGSAGGHNGLESIIRSLGTDNVPRLRVGIGAASSAGDLAEYVLSDFMDDEMPKTAEIVKKSADACEHWIKDGIEKAMNLYNG